MKEKLLTVKELAEKLKVPSSWVYSQTRKEGETKIPVIRVGKYCRFEEDEVLSWLRNPNRKDKE